MERDLSSRLLLPHRSHTLPKMEIFPSVLKFYSDLRFLSPHIFPLEESPHLSFRGATHTHFAAAETQNDRFLGLWRMINSKSMRLLRSMKYPNMVCLTNRVSGQPLGWRSLDTHRDTDAICSPDLEMETSRN